MSSEVAGMSSAQSFYRSAGYVAAMAGVRGSLQQQKILEQAVVKLIDAAAVPIDSNVGQNIDIYA